MAGQSNISMNETFIARYLAGEASPEEAQVLEDWLQSSPANRRQFEDYNLAWTAAGKTAGHLLPPVVEEWQRVSQQLDNRPRTKTLTRKRSLIRYALAASILLIVSAGISYFLLRREKAVFPELITIRSMNSIRSVQLPDHSTVVLNTGSTLTAPDSFATERREVNLHGEAWFDVAHDAAKPFQVNIDPVNIRVLGTSFNLSDNRNNNTIDLEVATGKVLMSNGRDSLVVSAGQSGVYDRSTGGFVLLQAFDPNSLGYATRHFNFSDHSLDTIGHYLEKAYGKPVRFENPALSHCKMTGEFENESLEYILDVIAATLKINYTIRNNVIYFSGAGCN